LKRLLKRILGRRVTNRLRATQRALLGAYYGLGNRVECTICGRTYSRFLRFAGRENQWCPHCGSLPRHRLLYPFLRDKMHFFYAKFRVLHFAAEACLAREIRKHGNIAYFPADLGASLIPGLSEPPELVMSVTHIGFRDGVFDVVLCNHVLEHVRDDRRAMRELHRVLKPGGYAILQVPIDAAAETKEDPTLGPEERAHLYGFADHLRLYGADYRERLAEAGFEVEVSRYVEELDAVRHALDEEEGIHVCWKR